MLDAQTAQGGRSTDAESASHPSGDSRLTIRRAVYVATVVAALVYAQVYSTSAEVSVVITPFVLAIGLNLLPLFWSRDADPFSPAAFNGLYATLGLAASLVSIIEVGKIELKWIPEMSPRAKEQLASTVVWSYVIAQISYLVGYYWPYRRGLNRPSRLRGLEWSPQRLTVACLLCFAIAVPIYAYFQARAGSDLSDITQLARGKAVWRDDPTQTWILRGMMLGYLPAMFLLAWVIERGRTSSLLLVGGFILLEGLLVLRAGQRGLMLGFFMTCAAIFHYMYRRIPIGLIAVGAFVAVVISNSLLLYRSQDADPGYTDPLRDRAVASRALKDHESDRQRLSTMAVIFYYFPEKQEFLYGQSWAGVIAMPIPRWLWAGKADAFTWRDTNIVPHLAGAAVPTPYHGVLYANFSWFGVVLGMLGWGLFQRRLYEWAMAARADKSVTLVYANALFVNAPTLLSLVLLTQFVLPVFLIILFIGYRRRGTVRGHLPETTHA